MRLLFPFSLAMLFSEIEHTIPVQDLIEETADRMSTLVGKFHHESL